jgi:hypothetical protein
VSQPPTVSHPALPQAVGVRQAARQLATKAPSQPSGVSQPSARFRHGHGVSVLWIASTDCVCILYMARACVWIRGMGESNAVTMRRGFLPRETLLAAAAIYEELYGDVLDSGTPRL